MGTCTNLCFLYAISDISWFLFRNLRQLVVPTCPRGRQIGNITAMTFSDLRAGDTVSFRTPQNQTRSGRVVMRGSLPDSFVLNCGGRHGTPAVVSPANFVSASRRRRA